MNMTQNTVPFLRRKKEEGEGEVAVRETQRCLSDLCDSKEANDSNGATGYNALHPIDCHGRHMVVTLHLLKGCSQRRMHQ